MLAVAFSLAAFPVPEEDVPAGDHSAVFERLKALAGDWEGTYEWSGARTGAGKMKASYYATGGGTALVENLTVDREPAMTSVYHLDGGRLRMTHYCLAGNQPRLRAERLDGDGATLRFVLVDVTNLAGPKAPHVSGFELRLVGEGRIVLTFTFEAGDALSRERIDLRRAVRAG